VPAKEFRKKPSEKIKVHQKHKPTAFVSGEIAAPLLEIT
jgi:hypothetical protein